MIDSYKPKILEERKSIMKLLEQTAIIEQASIIEEEISIAQEFSRLDSDSDTDE
jgi:hypothetical protein